ncbi:MAG TPA: GatB/YqeY domain-containing protein [Bacillota bacterium]
MLLRERLPEDLKTAMKNRETLRLSVIRMAKAAVMNQEIARGHELSDDEVIEVLAKEVKQRSDSIPEYERGNRPDIIDQLKQEIAILKGYLPAQLSEDELRRIIQETVSAIGATSKKEMGKVMAALMPKVRGRADGKLVNEIVGSLLQG